MKLRPMSNHDFWAIVTDPQAAGRWRAILRVDDESPRVPLMSPVPHIGDLPGIGRALLYRVAIDLLTTDERSRLVAHLAERFGESIQDVADHLDTEGLPIRASTCSVVIQNVQRWV